MTTHKSSRIRYIAKDVLQVVIAFVLACLILWLVKLFVVTQYTVTSSPAGCTFMQGDRLSVIRTSYGVRLPFTALFGCRRTNGEKPLRGEWMAFNLPTDTARPIEERPAIVSQCVALPGDTVRLSDKKTLLPHTAHGNKVRIITVPAAGKRVIVTRDNAALLCNTVNLHEPCHTAVMYGDTLYVDGHAARYVAFTQNYYWVYSGSTTDMNDSRTFGFVPENHLIGRASHILYSIDPDAPFYRMFRNGRFFVPLDSCVP